MQMARTRTTKTADGKVHIEDVPRSEWVVLMKDVHVGYISWEDYERNEAQLAMNSPGLAPERFSPPREGPALLQGLILCGRCGERMTVRYHQRAGSRIVPDYLCATYALSRENHRVSVFQVLIWIALLERFSWNV